MSGWRGVRSFSLLEVVIAAGIFSVAVVSILALLPVGARQAGAARDLQTALGLGDAVRMEVQRLVTPADFAGFSSLQLVAARDGTGLRPFDASVATGDQHFLVEVGPYTRTPLQFTAAVPLLVLSVRVSWPFHAGGARGPGGATTVRGRDRYDFLIAIRSGP